MSSERGRGLHLGDGRHVRGQWIWKCGGRVFEGWWRSLEVRSGIVGYGQGRDTYVLSAFFMFPLVLLPLLALS